MSVSYSDDQKTVDYEDDIKSIKAHLMLLQSKYLN